MENQILFEPWEVLVIKKDIQKHLVKMGKIKVYKKPNFNHEKTQDQYKSDLEKISGNINEIIEILSKKINVVRQRILGICTSNLESAFKYYYNTYTYSRDYSEEKKFIRSIGELRNFVRGAGLAEEFKEETEEKIKWLNVEFTRQAKYIQKVEKHIRDNNIEPFTEIVESLT